MKFPKSVHAEGWAGHIDTTPGALSKASEVPLTPSLSTTPPAAPRVAAAAPHLARTTADPAQRRVVAVPPQRQNPLSWMIAAGAGAAIVAAGAIWSMSRPSESPVTPAAVATGSAGPQAVVADATPVPDTVPAAAAAVAAQTTLAAATPAAVEPAPARPAPSLTMAKPATDTPQLAQVAVPVPRPDLMLRANPRSAALQPLPAQQAPTTVAAAPVAPVAPVAPPLTIEPGSAPLTLPPTAAGPAAVTLPLAQAAPDAAAAPAEAMPPLAQATPPAAEDAGITVQVRSALASDVTLAAVPIVVSTAQGVVRLEGQAPDAPTRERATVVASSATGVKAVDNRLTLPPAPLLSQAPSGL